MISFNSVPAALRYPGVYVEVDGSQAGLGGDLPTVLLVGQKLATGTAAAGTLTRISSINDAIAKAGAGSMLAAMAARYRAIDSVFDVFLLPYSDNAAGVQATGTITVNAAPTAAGTLALYVAGSLVSVGITAVMTVAQVATAIAAAINLADTALPVTASANAAVCTLTARHKGTCGNAVDMRLNLFSEPLPAGLGLSLAGMSGGVGDPAPGDLAAMLGNNRFWYIALGMNDAATLAAWHTESQRRYQPPIQAGFRAFTAHRGDYATAAAFGETKNYEHIVDLALELNPNTTWEAATTLAAAAAPALFANPAQSLEGIPLKGLLGVTYFDFTNANSLLYKGMSIMSITRDGACTIKRLISMYQFRADGSADDGYLDINAAELMERIRYEQRIGAIKRFAGTAAAKSPEGYRPGLRITTIDDITAYLLTLYKDTLMRENGWVQDYDYYKSQLLVEQDATNPSRFNYRDAPVLLSPFYILAGRGQFRKVAN